MAIGWARDRRANYIARTLGRSYGNNSGVGERQVNKLLEVYRMLQVRLTKSILVPTVEPRIPEARGKAKILELALRHLSREVSLAQTHRDAIAELTFSPMAIVRCGVRAGSDMVKVDDTRSQVGQWFASVIPLSQYGVDPTCDRYESRRFEYHWYDVDREMAMSLPIFDRRAIEMATRMEDSTRPSMARTIGTGQSDREDPISERILLCDIACKDQQGVWHIATMIGDGSQPNNTFAREWEPFQGPIEGPYVCQMMDRLPEQLFGLSPCAVIDDIDRDLASIGSHVINSIKATKRAYVYESGSDDFVMRLEQAKPFQAIEGDPRNIATIDTGGVVDQLFAGFEWANTIYGHVSSAASLMSGGKLDAKTATAAMYLQSQSQSIIEAMQERSAELAGKLLKHAGFYLLNDPRIQLPLSEMVDGEEIQLVYDAEKMDADADDFLYSIEPFSAMPMDASSRLARFNEAMQIIPAAIQAVAAIGGNPTVIADMAADEYGIDRFREIFPTPFGQAITQATAQGVAMMPPGSVQVAVGPPRTPIQQQRSDVMSGPTA